MKLMGWHNFALTLQCGTQRKENSGTHCEREIKRRPGGVEEGVQNKRGKERTERYKQDVKKKAKEETLPFLGKKAALV